MDRIVKKARDIDTCIANTTGKWAYNDR